MAETVVRKELREPFLDQVVEDTYFFNGRLLTAGDLTTAQTASRRRDRQLGLAVGAGVLKGLEVQLIADGADGQPPILGISQGLGFTRLGQALELPQAVEVMLAKQKPDALPNTGRFDACATVTNGTPLAGKGAYIFVARPAEGYKGLAPRRGFGQAAKVEGCDRDLVLEGLQFRLVELELAKLAGLTQAVRDALATLMTQPGDANLAKLRNWLAHVCLGTEERREMVRTLLPAAPGLPPFEKYGAADALRSAGVLDDCDLPLALVFWPSTGVKFVDNWAVRRRPSPPDYGPWSGLIGDRVAAEGEAAFMQFQTQIAELTRPTVLRAQLILAKARDYFRYLPATGVIPFTTGASVQGYDYLQFFSGMTVREPIFMEGRRVQSLLHMSMRFAPIDLATNEMVWIYLVRENREPFSDSPTPSPQPYLIFTHGLLPYQGPAMYDLGYWNFGNYS